MARTKTILVIFLVCTVLVSVFAGCTKDEKTPIKIISHGPPSLSTQAGDLLSFGHYEQDRDPTNGKEPIAWRVLAVEDGKAFLFADSILDKQPYHVQREDVSWENCSLRAWLNTEFYNEAFTLYEQERILLTDIVNDENPEVLIPGEITVKDKVFLLSLTDVTNPAFGFDSDAKITDPSRKVVFPASESQGAWFWWLRTPADPYIAYSVLSSGEVYDKYYVYLPEVGVRPALWITL